MFVAVILLAFACSINAQTATIVAVDCVAVNPTWFEWGAWSGCSDTCGGCGSQTRQRTCRSSSASCECPGNSTMSQSCQTEPCKYPRDPCCPGTTLTTGSDGKFACASLIGK